MGQTRYFISSVSVSIENKNKLVSQTIVQWSDGITNPPPRAEAEINYCPMCGRKLTEEVNVKEFTDEELWKSLSEPDLKIELQSGHRYGAMIMSVNGSAENCEMKLKVNFTEE